MIAQSRVRDYILAVANAEWDSEDFEEFGSDLLAATWKLETVEVSKIKARPELMRSKRFLADLQSRIEGVTRRIAEGTPIPPLILRGGDYLIFDGYARLHVLKAKAMKKCLAYVGRPEGSTQVGFHPSGPQ